MAHDPVFDNAMWFKNKLRLSDNAQLLTMFRTGDHKTPAGVHSRAFRIMVLDEIIKRNLLKHLIGENDNVGDT